MVAHHEVVAFGDDLGAPVVVAAELVRHVAVLERHLVSVHAAVDDADLIARFGDDALDERLLRVDRIVEHHDIADPRIREPVRQLVDDEPVLVLERRRHALALDARNLEAERDDERRVDGSRGERLEPREQALAETREPLRPRVERQADGRRVDRPGAHLRRRSFGDGGERLRAGSGQLVRVAREREPRGLRWRVGVVRSRAHSFRYSRSRLVCARLTGISVAFASFILRM